MRNIFIYLIKIYQIFLSPFIKNALGIKGSCRHEVTCSDYARFSIMNDGIIKGSYKSVLRILRCQPFSN